MKLLPTYAKTDAGLIVRDGYFNTSTGIRYAVLEGQADKGGEVEIQWVTVWSVVAYINAGDEPMAYLSVDYPTVDEALAELDRIAALIEGKAPAQGWVAGAPPKDGQWYVIYGNERPSAAYYNDHLVGYVDDNYRVTDIITHHLPTPIQPPKES